MKKPVTKRRGQSAKTAAAAVKGSAGQKPVEHFLDEIRARIKTEMDTHDISMRGLSRKAGLGSNTVRHALEKSSDISVQTLLAVAAALGMSPAFLITGAQSAYGALTSAPLDLRLLPVFAPHEAENDKPERDLGYVCIQGKNFPADTRAMCVDNSAMVPVGQNQPVPPQNVILRDDIVLWSRSAPWQPGMVVVAKLKGGNYLVRRVQELDDGGYQLVSNDESHARVKCSRSDVAGPVLAVWRRTAL